MNVPIYDFVRIVRLLLTLIRIASNGRGWYTGEYQKAEDEIDSELSKLTAKGLDQLGKKP